MPPPTKALIIIEIVSYVCGIVLLLPFLCVTDLRANTHTNTHRYYLCVFVCVCARARAFVCMCVLCVCVCSNSVSEKLFYSIVTSLSLEMLYSCNSRVLPPDLAYQTYRPA